MTTPGWATRISLEGDALEKNRQYNKRIDLHGEWVHPDRFRYSHIVEVDGDVRIFSCGGKYDPDDISNCPFCQANKYGRSFEEACNVADGIYVYPYCYDINDVVSRWSKKQPAQIIKSRK